MSKVPLRSTKTSFPKNIRIADKMPVSVNNILTLFKALSPLSASLLRCSLIIFKDCFNKSTSCDVIFFFI